MKILNGLATSARAERVCNFRGALMKKVDAGMLGVVAARSCVSEGTLRDYAINNGTLSRREFEDVEAVLFPSTVEA